MERKPGRGIQDHLNMERALSHLKPALSPMGPSGLSTVDRWSARRRLTELALVSAMTAMLAVAVTPAHAKLYKWVDEHGVVHYTDTMPPDAVNKGNVELSKQGVEIKKTDPAGGPEARRAREAEEERRQQATKDQQETLRRDRAVLDSYTSEQDIDLAKTRSLKTVEQAVQSAQGYIDQLNKRREALVAKKADVKDKAASAANDRDLARIDDDIARQTELVARKRAEMTALIVKYDSDKERWRAAKVRADSQATVPPQKGSTAAGTAQAGKSAK